MCKSRSMAFNTRGERIHEPNSRPPPSNSSSSSSSSSARNSSASAAHANVLVVSPPSTLDLRMLAAAESNSAFSSPSSPSEEGEGAVVSLQQRMTRITKLLREIQSLTPACEEVRQPGRDDRDRQVFIRRILQVSTELQDTRDALQELCRPPVLTKRQFEFVFAPSRGDSSDDDDEVSSDPYLDPSVRFFGLDWQQLFARCLSLSLNLRVAAQQLETPGTEADLVLLSGVRRDLARIEVDVASHGEAVMHGRLSKSQQRIILQEQARVASLTPSQQSSRARVAKSRSFRDTSRQRQAARYRKNKTTDLNKLSARLDAPSAAMASGGRSQEEIRGEWREVMDEARRKEVEEGESKSASSSRKSSFIQNVSSLFKHIR